VGFDGRRQVFLITRIYTRDDWVALVSLFARIRYIRGVTYWIDDLGAVRYGLVCIDQVDSCLSPSAVHKICERCEKQSAT
jgi:hypothetical protein